MIKPLYDRILVRRKEKETTTEGGIYIPESSTEKPLSGEVVAVGDGKFTATGVLALKVAVGDKILFGKYAGTEIQVNGEDMLIMKEEDIMGIYDC